VLRAVVGERVEVEELAERDAEQRQHPGVHRVVDPAARRERGGDRERLDPRVVDRDRGDAVIPEPFGDGRSRAEPRGPEIHEGPAGFRDLAAAGGVEDPVPGQPPDAHAAHVAVAHLHALGGGGLVEELGRHDEGLVAGDGNVTGDVEQDTPPDDSVLGPGQHAAVSSDLLRGAGTEEPSGGVPEVPEPVPLRRGLGEEVVQAVIEDGAEELEDLVAHRLATEERRRRDVEREIEAEAGPPAHQPGRVDHTVGGEPLERAELGVEVVPRAAVGKVAVRGPGGHGPERTSSTERTRVSCSNKTSLYARPAPMYAVVSGRTKLAYRARRPGPAPVGGGAACSAWGSCTVTSPGSVSTATTGLVSSPGRMG